MTIRSMERYFLTLLFVSVTMPISAHSETFSGESAHANIIISIVLSILVGLLLMIYLRLFIRDRAMIMQTLSSKDYSTSQTKTNTRSFQSFFSSILPVEFEDKPWFEIYITMIKRCHPWISFTAISSDPSHIINILEQQNNLYGSNKEYRAVDEVDFQSTRLLTLAARLCHFMFIDTLIVGFLLRGNKSCDQLKTVTACDRTVSINIISNECYWDQETQQCKASHRASGEIYLAVVITSGAMLALSIWFDRLFYWLGRLGNNSFFYGLALTEIFNHLSPDAKPTGKSDLEDIESSGIKFGDELTRCQTRISILKKGARITKLLVKLDQLSPEQELDLFQMSARDEQWYRAAGDQTVGKSVSKVIINQLDYLGYDFMHIYEYRPMSTLAEVSPLSSCNIFKTLTLFFVYSSLMRTALIYCCPRSKLFARKLWRLLSI